MEDRSEVIFEILAGGLETRDAARTRSLIRENNEAERERLRVPESPDRGPDRP